MGSPSELACLVRFQMFPFIEDHLKQRPLRQILEMDVGNAKFQELIKPLVETNQFVRFCKSVNHIHRKRWILVPLPAEVDVDLVLALFWEESNEVLAGRILRTLLRFPTRTHPSLWTSGVNLLLRASTVEDKECALVMLEAFSD